MERGGAFPISFDRQLYGAMAIKKAVYKYMNYFTADIDANEKDFCCLLSFASGIDNDVRLKLVEDFKKEVLDQQLREDIKSETEPIRNLILAHAFSKTGLTGNEQVSGS